MFALGFPLYSVYRGRNPIMILMLAPTVWPFRSPVTPAWLTPSGAIYKPDSNGIFPANPLDVSSLLDYGFKVYSSSGTTPTEIVVDLNELSPVILSIFASASG